MASTPSIFKESTRAMLTDLQMQDLFAVLPSLAASSPAMFRRLRAEVNALHLSPGSTVFEDGVKSSGLVVVARGSIRVVRAWSGGREIVLYRVTRGDLCLLTLACLLGGRGYPAVGVAEEDVQGFAVPSALFDDLMNEAGQFRAAVLQVVGTRLLHLMSLVEEVAFQPLEERLAATLLRISPETESRELPMTHQQLADELGTSREIVSRILESWASHGIIELGRRRIVIHDSPRLLAISGQRN